MEDLRQRRTKKHLMNALVELMEERPFTELSVVDICERAMVHRTTFYAHFTDKEDLLRYTLDQLWQSFVTEETREAQGRGRMLTAFRNALHFIRAHQKLYLASLGAGGMITQMLENYVAQDILGRMDRPDEASVYFCLGGCLTLVRWWLERGLPMDEGQLLEKLDALLPPDPDWKE